MQQNAIHHFSSFSVQQNMGCRQSRVVPVTNSVEPKIRSRLSPEMCTMKIFDCAGNKQSEIPHTAVFTPPVQADATISIFIPICSDVETVCTSSRESETATTRIAALIRPRGARGRRRLQQPLINEERAVADSTQESAAEILKRPTAAVYTRRPARVAYTRYSEEWMAARDRRVGFHSSNAVTRYSPPRTVLIRETDEITVRPLAARTRRGAWYETSVQPSARFRLHRHH